jgi:hypothetical protein
VIVAIPMTAEQRLLQILKRLWVLPVDIRISAAAAELKLSPRAYTYLGKLPLLNVFERPLSGWDSFLKSVHGQDHRPPRHHGAVARHAGVALAVKLESKGPRFSGRSASASTTSWLRSSSSAPCTPT